MPESKKIEFITPVGRLVGGSPFEPQTKDHNGEPLVIRRGPNAGQPTIRYYMGLAISKTDPALGEFMAKLYEAAQSAFPNLFDPSGNCLNPNFAWKYKDGDSQQLDTKGRRPCDREGYPGHYVFGFSGSHAPKVHGDDPTKILTDPNSIKRGYYIRILGSTVGNDEPSKPGIYLNYSCVQFVAFGEEIQLGPDGVSAFNAAPVAALPAGASRSPLPPSTAPSGPSVAPPPHMMGAPAVAAPPPAPVASTDVTINGVTYSRDALLAAGWTDSQIQAAVAG